MSRHVQKVLVTRRAGVTIDNAKVSNFLTLRKDALSSFVTHSIAVIFAT